mmetsp:Transcript_13510/g.28185  ORF Transcript_13510/g.28185 Transcript_13510/m.28185 type:complete len:250 (+) Transcript_13510:40-789(+)
MLSNDSPSSLSQMPTGEPADGGETSQSGLVQSESNASIITTGSDGGPPAQRPPQTVQSVFRRGEVLQPHLKLNAPTAQTAVAPMQIVRAYPTLHRAENGRPSRPAPSERPQIALPVGGQTSRVHPHEQAMPMASQATSASAPPMVSHERAEQRRVSVPAPKREAAPTWVIEEVIDFGLTTDVVSEPDREVSDAAFHRVVNARLMHRAGLFESCAADMCADEDRDQSNTEAHWPQWRQSTLVRDLLCLDG